MMTAKSNLSCSAWISIGCGAMSIAYSTFWFGMFAWHPESTETGLEAIVMVPALMLSTAAVPIALVQAWYRVWPPLWVATLSWVVMLVAFGKRWFYTLF